MAGCPPTRSPIGLPPEVSRKDHTVPAPTPTTGDPLVNVLLFGLFVAATLFAVFRAARGNRTASDYYTGGQGLSGAANGVALTGDYLSAAAFLGVIGAVAAAGYDGVTFALGSLVGWVVALLLLAERMRNTGRYTMGDVLGFRTDRRRVRAAAATSTVLISLLYLVAQIAGAGGLFALLLGIPNTDRGMQSLVIALAGVLMIVYVLVGGMRGTTAVQILKACAEVARHPRGTDRRLVVDPRHYDGPGTGRVVAPAPLGRMGRRLQELAEAPVLQRSIELYAALAEVAR